MDPDNTLLMSIDIDSQCSQVASNSDCGGKTFLNQLDGPGLGAVEQLCRGVNALNTKVQCVEEATCIPKCTRSEACGGPPKMSWKQMCCRPTIKRKRKRRKPQWAAKPKPKGPRKKTKSCRPKKKKPKGFLGSKYKIPPNKITYMYRK